MIHLIYSIFIYAAAALLSPLLALLILTKRKYREGLGQKLGFFLPNQTRPTIWIHAVSVGESLAAIELVKSLDRETKDYRILLSTTTHTGQEVAKKLLAPIAQVFYFPYDLPGAARRAVRAINPAALVLIDTELWPNVIRAARKHGCKVALVNGRISDRSFPRYRRFYWLIKPILRDFSSFMMQSENDGRRMIEIGADPNLVETPGNLKFDRAIETVSDERRAGLRASLGLGPDDPVIFLGSVHEGEEAAISAALKARRTLPGLRLVLAPRRIDEFEWIEKALEGSGLTLVRKTRLAAGAGEAGKNTAVVIDTFGELASYYSIADVAFVGGSLIPHGGQNPLEPAAHGVPVVFGPAMSNFREAAAALGQAGCAWTASTEDELEEIFRTLLGDTKMRKNAGEAAKAVVAGARGATDKVVERILELIGNDSRKN